MGSRFARHSILVTGSTSGIGLATARRLHDDGARVILHGRRSPSELPDLVLELLESDRVSYVVADLSKPDQARELADLAQEQAGSLSGVVLNAAVELHKPWDETTAAEWDSVMSVNVRSALLITQGAAPYLTESQGSIVVVSSTNALRVNTSNLVYDSSKAALNHMARALALELKSEGIRVNTVMPGGVDTPMLSRWLGDYAGSPAAAKKVLEDGISSGAVGTPDDIASAILFLLSDDARWVTGAQLVVDGGAYLSG
jgi:NAD(P)-dependent dehydrogenase (short-subunit alcohol dehydrogenase family)